MIEGKGYFIWKLENCEDGNPDWITRAAIQGGFKHVLIKIADGICPYNQYQKLEETIQKLLSSGIEVLGWHYVYGEQPVEEAERAAERIQTLGLKTYVIDAEVEYKGRYSQAKAFCKKLKELAPNVSLVLSSFRFPSFHPTFPWNEFLSAVDINMPQVYWITANNPDRQLRTCISEFHSGSYPMREIIPTGAAYRDNQHHWNPTTEEVELFLKTAHELGVRAVNFWEWGNARQYTPQLFEVVAGFDWETGTPGEIEPVEPEAIPALLARVTTTAGLNVRQGPGVQYSRWFTLSTSQQVEVLEQKQTKDGSLWVRIGQRQWCAMKYFSPSYKQLRSLMEWIPDAE